jgi:hypothetical protein
MERRAGETVFYFLDTPRSRGLIVRMSRGFLFSVIFKIKNQLLIQLEPQSPEHPQQVMSMNKRFASDELAYIPLNSLRTEFDNLKLIEVVLKL